MHPKFAAYLADPARAGEDQTDPNPKTMPLLRLEQLRDEAAVAAKAERPEDGGPLMGRAIALDHLLSARVQREVMHPRKES